MEDKFIKLSHFEELLRLYDKRDRHYDWSNEYEKYDNKIKVTTEWLINNAKTKEFIVNGGTK